ncbi:hypothetical protein NIES2100_70220 [Calothrix sp. NIES-2100]|uniref:NYN domain-containing protein n=1 Tax=Calothrix sp. NIES-2100 TaxID=1954172 RepID=UPI000B620715|nr:hypothetical protein NIES2100_70220 [Calothrix sp. NIES-2100]
MNPKQRQSKKHQNTVHIVMSDANQFPNRQTSQQQNYIAIFWDIQNVSSIQGKGHLLLKFAESQGRIECKNVYYNSGHQNQVSAKNNLEVLGFKSVDVPDSSENSADYRLIYDCTQLFTPKSSPNPNIIILVLGDWDYAGLICMLKSLVKKVIIFAQQGSASPKLIKLVGSDNFYFIDELPQLVANETQLQTTVVDSQISYNEAIDYLTEAIKTALQKGKPTVFGYIDKLMRQRCANYQGVSSIMKPDGKPFSRFSKFVDVAVKDGKVKMQNQQLFLIELGKLAD